MAGEAADMELVDDRTVEPARLDALDRGTLRHDGPKRRMPGLGGSAALRRSQTAVAHGARPWVEQLLARMKRRPVCSVSCAVHPPRVAGARGQAFDEHVPEMEGAVRPGKRDDLERLGRVRRLEQQQLDARGMAAVDAEVDAAVAWPAPGGSAIRAGCVRAMADGQSSAIPTGGTFQMRSQYSRIDRSEENLPSAPCSGSTCGSIAADRARRHRRGLGQAR